MLVWLKYSGVFAPGAVLGAVALIMYGFATGNFTCHDAGSSAYC